MMASDSWSGISVSARRRAEGHLLERLFQAAQNSQIERNFYHSASSGAIAKRRSIGGSMRKAQPKTKGFGNFHRRDLPFRGLIAQDILSCLSASSRDPQLKRYVKMNISRKRSPPLLALLLSMYFNYS